MTISGELLTQLKLRSGPPPIVVVTKLQSLPFGSLRWDDFEKLCLRVVLLDHEVEDARRYGVPGQDQGGIDLYARCAKNGKYTAYQCKKVDRLGPADIGSAVDLFLAGPWANKVAKFVICCSVSFAATQMTNQLEAERERLVGRGVTLEAWDADALNIRLKGQPLLVEEFFGCQAAAAFCADGSACQDQREHDDSSGVLPDEPPLTRAGEVDRLLGEAVSTAHMIVGMSAQASALAYVASWLHTRDSERARRLFDDAERLARSDRNDGDKAAALANIGRHLLSVDPDHAMRLLVDAEDVFQANVDDFTWGSPFAAIASVLVVIEPDRAERLAQSVTIDGARSAALVSLAKALAAVDLDRAERVVASITDEYFKAMAWADIVPTAAYLDVDRAESIAQAIDDEFLRISALADVARALATTDPDRANRLVAEAKRLARSISSVHSRICALIHVAWASIAIDRRDSSKLLAEAERAARLITDCCSRAMLMLRIVQVMAFIDAKRAERIARGICDEYCKSDALASVAEAIAPTGPGHAERIARLIADNSQKSFVFMEIVKALSSR